MNLPKLNARLVKRQNGFNIRLNGEDVDMFLENKSFLNIVKAVIKAYV